jgi:hypothetical protein
VNPAPGLAAATVAAAGDANGQVTGVVAVLRELRGDVVEFVAPGQAA